VQKQPKFTTPIECYFNPHTLEYSLSEISIAADFVLHNKRHQLIAFYGEMGVGKTTLIKAICKKMGVDTEVSSPTFSLVNEYQAQNGQIIYHFDFYRIQSIEEVYDIGYEDYFYSGNLCLIEWPERIASLLENEAVDRVYIKENNDGNRTIKFA
jgi:tRNA threonylcarbamoyladenosine biosynthesis protein TsaE